MIKKDGHTHTEFCPHGSGDDVELMIQKAIQLGFEEYCITEHAPLPPAFEYDYAGEPTGFSEASMAFGDVDDYFAKVALMKQRYGDQIKIKVGFEVDFLPQYVDWTRSFLNQYQDQIDESVLSVHFLPGVAGKYWCVDDTTEDFELGLLESVDEPQALYQRYLEQVKASVQADLGPQTPVRIGHLDLIKKFQDDFNLPNQFDSHNQELIDEILVLIQKQHRQLDFNIAGLYKSGCNEPYLDLATIGKARQLGIPMVYGSDAHSIAEVGRAQHLINYF
ncbi:histidinol-phosphatase HisJ [Lactobacillaceae bacterium Scapto_B20]